MEFIRYVCKEDLDVFKNHDKTLGDLIKDSYYEPDIEAVDKNPYLPEKVKDCYCFNIPITITINDVDVTI